MLNPSHPLAELLRRDNRYHFDSYVFVFDALRFAQERLDMGRVVASSSGQDAADEYGEYEDDEIADLDDIEELEEGAERHVTGQDLCEAIRQYALSQYGLLAKSVLNHWGVHSTGDFGEIVFNLIDIGQMRKTDNDRREDFNDVYDFSQALTDGYVFATESEDKESSD
ncbi:MAG: Minf_1886 family protein [Planctomycetota bacterium]